MVNNSLEGILDFNHEGIKETAWCFQDKNFINLVQVKYPLIGGTVYDSNNHNRKGKILSSETLRKGKWLSIEDEGFGLKDITRATVEWQDGIIEKKRYSKDLLELKWCYNGMHILENGDDLTIYHPKTKKEVWSGLIEFREPKPFQDYLDAVLVPSDSMNVKQETWLKYFLKNYPAKLNPVNQ